MKRQWVKLFRIKITVARSDNVCVIIIASISSNKSIFTTTSCFLYFQFCHQQNVRHKICVLAVYLLPVLLPGCPRASFFLGCWNCFLRWLCSRVMLRSAVYSVYQFTCSFLLNKFCETLARNVIVGRYSRSGMKHNVLLLDWRNDNTKGAKYLKGANSFSIYIICIYLVLPAIMYASIIPALCAAYEILDLVEEKLEILWRALLLASNRTIIIHSYLKCFYNFLWPPCCPDRIVSHCCPRTFPNSKSTSWCHVAIWFFIGGQTCATVVVP